MARVTDDQLLMLSFLIVKKIKEEFAIKKLSGNLLNTISVTEDADGIHINIPAKTYNMLKFQVEGVLVHTSNGSYASKLDMVGSEFPLYDSEGKYIGRAKPHNHIGYIERVLLSAIEEWKGTCSLSVTETRIL